ncbi:MAG: UvrD-helicase domain-containing protein, partial [Pseudomonadales bacterium]|nr:UvrD-helicase domain-containing protein [Pseudomonadales bacterium]
MSILVDAQQRLDALDCRNSYIVQAPAGSGKTGVLTQRILGLLALVEKPEEVVAITFTKKAAGEMRQRVLESLLDANGRACPDNDYEAQTWHLCQAVIERDKLMGWNLLRHPNRLKVQTIDGFCSSLVKQMPFESSMGAMPSIEDDASAIYEKAAKQLINSLGEGDFYDGALQSLLTHLDNNYRLAVNLIAQMLDKRDHWLENLVTARQHDGDLKSLLEDTLRDVVESQISALNQCLPESIKQQLMSLALYAAHNLALDKKESPLNAALAVENDASFIDTPQAWAVFAELLLTKGKPSYRKRVDAKLGFPAPTSSKDPEEKTLRKQRKADLTTLIGTLEAECPGFNEQLFDI